MGSVLGVVFDSLLLGGTIINYNKTNMADEDGRNFPLKGFLRWAIVVLQFFIIKLAWEYFVPGSMRNLWINKLWMFLVPFVFFSVTKYFFKAMKLTKDYVTYKDVQDKWNERMATAAHTAP